MPFDAATFVLHPADMSFTSKIHKGVIVVPPGLHLPEGTEVEVTPSIGSGEAEAFTDALLRIAAKTRELPPDLAENHDHYLHDLPKK